MITKVNWLKYIQRLAAIDKRAGDQMQAWIDEHGLTDIQAAIDYAYGLATKYGETSATLSAEMYDYMADVMDADVPAAIPADTATMSEIAKALNWARYHSPGQIPSIVGRHVRQAGADTMMQNAKRDKAQWAWVPQGDTCAFCMTLASRGWQEASKTVLKGNHAEHIHQNCDCTFAIAFKEKDKRRYDSIYDRDKYLDMYNEAGGDINEMRRQIYAKNKDEINAHRRDVYQAKTFRKSLSIQQENGKINIEIDEFTPCLRRNSDNTIVKTSITQIHPKKKDYKGWLFDWTKPEKNGFKVYQLLAEGDDRIQGMIAMIAEPNNYAVHIDIVESAPFNNPVSPLFSGQKEYYGVGGHLFAEAVKQSYEAGYDGYVYFDAKTNLIEYYKKELGAEPIVEGSNRMFIDGKEAKKLFERYYGERK